MLNSSMYAKSYLESSGLSKLDQTNSNQHILRHVKYEQNKLMNSYLSNQVNSAIKFSCVLDFYDLVQENYNIPDEQIQQQYHHRLLHRNRGVVMQDSVEEIGEQVRILQNNQETFFQRFMRCLGIIKRVVMQPISKYIISLLIQKYVTQFVWQKTSYCLPPQLAAGLTSLSFGLFYLKLKDSKKFLHENYLWFFGSSMFIYFNIQQNMREVTNLSIGN